MNATDHSFQEAGFGNPISQFVGPWFSEYPLETLSSIEHIAWWAHIIGILIFLNEPGGLYKPFLYLNPLF